MSRVPNKVASAYEALLQEFQRVAEDANQTVSVPHVPLQSCFRPSGDDTTVTFETCLYLKGWPCRKLPRGKRMDVLIKVLEMLKRREPLSRNSWCLTQSTVYLNYVVVADPIARIAQSLRFDFPEGGKSDHPIFHVQLTTEQIPTDDVRKAGFDLELKLPDQANECWVTTRIPTPDMTLASVLYCLVADHLRTSFFRDFAARVHSIQERLPHPSFGTLKNSLQKTSTHFKSSHWFAHMLEPREEAD